MLSRAEDVAATPNASVGTSRTVGEYFCIFSFLTIFLLHPEVIILLLASAFSVPGHISCNYCFLDRLSLRIMN